MKTNPNDYIPYVMGEFRSMVARVIDDIDNVVVGVDGLIFDLNITGASIINQNTLEYEIHKGPIIAKACMRAL